MRRIGRGVTAAWGSLWFAWHRWAAHESSAVDEHMQAMQGRASVAGQAGDLPTLLRDQLDLLPGSQERLRANLQASLAIADDLLADLGAIWRDLWRREVS